MSHNNLGGVGPDSGAENIRYAGVGSLNGRAFDLLVEVMLPLTLTLTLPLTLTLTLTSHLSPSPSPSPLP